jgi:DNA modification methylase
VDTVNEPGKGYQVSLPILDEEGEKEKLGKATRASKKRANDLDGATWTRYSISIWSDIRKTKEEAELGHPAIFPLALVSRLIQCFTTEEDRVVLDPFAGIGSTAIAAESLGKIGIGIELSPEYAEKARKRPSSHDMFGTNNKTGERHIYEADANDLLSLVQPRSVDLVITSPPYWDILLQERTADYKQTRHYGDSLGDLGKIRDYQKFLAALKKVFALVYEVLKGGKYCCVVVMDLRKKDKYYPYHSDIAAFMQDIGFIFDDIIIWDRRHEYNLMRPLGYPSKFRINKAHEYILIFQKPGE